MYSELLSKSSYNRFKWQKLASLAQAICTLWFQFFGAVFASKGYPFKNIFNLFCSMAVVLVILIGLKLNFSCSQEKKSKVKQVQVFCEEKGLTP